MENKTSDAQIKASRKWEEKNKEKARHGSAKRSAKSFIKNHATLEELDEFEEVLKTRREYLKNL